MKKIFALLVIPALFFASCNKDEKDKDKEEENPIVITPAAVKGCMDKESLNYNEKATEDDGSCKYVEKVNYPVVVDVTATWCPPCGSYGIPFFAKIVEAQGESAVSFSLHATNSNLANPTSIALMNAGFATSTIPKFFVNETSFGVYTTEQANNQYAQQYADAVKGATVYAALYGEYTIDATTGEYSTNIWTKFYEYTEGNYTMGVYVIEDGLVSPQVDESGKYNNEQVHNHVLVGAISDALGTKLEKTAFAPNDVINAEYKAIVPVTNVENTHVVAVLFLKNGATVKVVNAFNLKHMN